MSAQIIDGKAIAEAIRGEIKAEVDVLREKYHKVPGLAAVIVGERKDSQTYVRLKHKAAAECGFASFNVELPGDVSQAELEAQIVKLNENPECHGIIVQLPLPKHIDENRALEVVQVTKDADALLPINVGLLHCKGREPLFLPCTPAGVIEMLQRTNIPIEGRRAVVLGRSNIVGAPVAALLMKHNATVTVVHSATPMPVLEETVKSADIVIAAMGKPGFVQGSWIKDGAAVIDVGTTPVDDATKKAGYRLAGDVCFQEAAEHAAYISPVPGGVGPMTIAMLLKNTLQGFKNSVTAE
ncbi:C-1-tetrahydrofolate synthase, cytoplasmic [Strigomonas culicis]|uniref:C-1-tetrahydrofolate synthase, cytoplasmic n=2 Tax=Strigomonas culicis TaxID=28005 RepID=S9W2X6_9TRYP|nr:C-1-tetrahydrofolate synthase, cytoplasmic [Strigomonas culicis]|eukprot:EPY33686.1 C-1-tetrahydrofolate synthase, cytoplasmic [Strigomonas culicis]